MWIFIKLAYGNLVKNRKNSLTILTVIFVCVFFMEFGVAFVDGFKQKMLGDFLNEAGHINIYDSRYYKEIDTSINEYNIGINPEFIGLLKNHQGVTAVRPEINFGAIANTEKKNLKCMVTAVEPESAAKNYGKLARSLVKGKFISKKEDILIGVRCAKLLDLDVGDKMVILSVDRYGSVNAEEGTIAGIFKTFSAQQDERSVICSLPLAQKLLGMEGRVTKISVNISDPVAAVAEAKNIEKLLPPGAIAVPWQTGQAYVLSYVKLLDLAIIGIAFVIILCASMGIINSFLMNIMHRLPEFGALRAMGLGKAQMYFMIITESFILGLTGTVAALIPGTAVVLYFQAHPFNYEKIFSSMNGTALGMMDASMSTVFVPISAAIILLTGILISVIASSYPAFIAISKKPSEIMRVLE
jgi:putative ABC transport system permease protein